MAKNHKGGRPPYKGKLHDIGYRQRERIRKLYADGMGTRVLGEMYGVSHTTMTTWLAKMGVKRRLSETRSKCRREKDPTGERHYEYQIMKRSNKDTYPASWVALCSCGNLFEILEHKIGVYKSCGCRQFAKRKKN